MFSVSNIQSTPGATEFGDGECIIPLEIDVQDISYNIEVARKLGIMVDPRLLILLMTTGLLTA